MSGWWESITTSAQLLVDEISAQANEASNEIVSEQMKLKREEASRSSKAEEGLPWDTEDESKTIISQALMADILQLALCEKNFTESPPSQIVECCNFTLQKYISVAMKLLSLDQNLAHAHAKISPKMEEEVFWENYFSRIHYLKCKSGIFDTNEDAMVQAVSSFDENDVIFRASSSVDQTKSGTSKSPQPDKLTPNVLTNSPPKKNAWENSSNEDNSSGMSMSSYEVLNASGMSDYDKTKTSDSLCEENETLYKAERKETPTVEEEDTKDITVDDLENDDDDLENEFADLDEFDDLDDLGDDDDELEAQIARELANEE